MRLYGVLALAAGAFYIYIYVRCTYTLRHIHTHIHACILMRSAFLAEFHIQAFIAHPTKTALGSKNERNANLVNQ